jgi:hypothetical protein
MRNSFSVAVLSVVIACTLSGCQSDHDLKRNGYNVMGGGYIDDEVSPGLYSIKGYSNFAIFSSLERDGAERTFLRRADTLCGAGAYTVIDYKFGGYNANLHVTYVTGHVLCANSGITPEEARKILAVD